jgi:glycosyltransferase involved in cell wall biosynthesis
MTDVNTGETLFAEGKIEEAEKCFLKIVSEDSGNKVAYNNLGVVAFRKQDIVGAIDYFARSLQIDPFYKDAAINLSGLLRNLNRLHEVVPFLERITERHPNDEELIRILEDARSKAQVRLKVAVLCIPGLESFLGDIITFLRNNYEVRTCYSNNKQEIESAARWADIVWLEWANEMTVAITNHTNLLKGKRVICRLHSYEAFAGYVQKIKWERINDVVFVADHIKNFVIQQIPKLPDLVQDIHVIPNGIDLNKFSFKDRKKGWNLAYVGNISYKKGPMLLLHAFQELAQVNGRYNLYIAGLFQDARYSLYFGQMLAELGLEKRVHFDGWVKDINAWLDDKQYIVCASVLEGHPVGLMEAMACGLKPVIHNFVGARRLYPDKFIWNSIPEFVAMVTGSDYDSSEYRKFVEDRFSLQHQLASIEAIVGNLGKQSKQEIVQSSVSAAGQETKNGEELSACGEVDKADSIAHLYKECIINSQQLDLSHKNDTKGQLEQLPQMPHDSGVKEKIGKGGDPRISLFNKVTVGVVVKDRLFNLETLVNSLYREYKDFQLIIVVNGSVDEMLLEYIGSIKSFENIHILELAEHLWCAGAREAMTRYFKEEIASDYLVYLDDDMLMEKHALSKMLKYAEDYKGVLCFRLKYADRYISQAGEYHVANSQFRAKYPHRQIPMEGNAVYEGNLVTHGCSMFPREVLERVPFPEGYAQGFEDYYHSLKLKQGHVKVWGVPVDVIHYSHRAKYTDIDTFNGIIKSARQFYSDTKLYSEYLPVILGNPNISEKELENILLGDQHPNELFPKSAKVVQARQKRAVILVGEKNAGKYLQYCVHSLLKQTYDNILIVILDDHSDDLETKDIITKLSHHASVIAEEFGKGKLGNWVNALDKYCKGDDVVFLVDGDDGLLYIDAIDRIMEVYDSRSDISFVYSGLWNAKEGCEQFGYDQADCFATHLRSFRCSLWEVADKNMLRDPKTNEYWKSAVDRALMAALLCGGTQIMGIKMGCYYYRNYLDSNNHNDSKKREIQKDCHQRLNQLIQEKRSGQTKINVDSRVMSPGDFKALLHLAGKVPNGGKILELGSFSGNSTMALLLPTNGKNIEIHCVDTWEGSPNDNTETWYNQSNIFSKFKQNIEQVADNPDRVHTHRMKTSAFGFGDVGFFDMIFIDASHEEEDVFADILNSISCLQPDGILCGHDWGKHDFPGIMNAVKRVGIDVEVFPNSSLWVKKAGKVHLGVKNEINWKLVKTTAPSSPKKVLFIVSGPENRVSSYPFAFKEKRFPMGIAYMSKVLRENGHHVELLDRFLQPTGWRNDIDTFDFVGIYVSSPTRGDAYHILEQLHNLKSRPVIAVGGPHCSYRDDKLDRYVDYKVMGEGEGVIAPLVAGQVRRYSTIKTERIKDIGSLPMADYSLFEGMPYDNVVPLDPTIKPVWVMNTSRGCPYLCSFCQMREIWGTKYYAQSAERIVNDIKYLKKEYEIKGVYFREDNFTCDRKRLEEFCELSIGLDIKWFAESRADIPLELLPKMKMSGCRGLYVGVESGSQRMLDIFNKKIQVDRMKEFLLECKEIGIAIAASIIRNHPQELPEDVLKTNLLLAETKPTLVWENPWKDPSEW